MSVTASLEPAVQILRLHDAGGYGAPYHGSATVIGRGDTAELRGMTMQGAFTKAHREAVFAALRQAGFRWAEWERRTQAGTRLVRRDLRCGQDGTAP